MAINYLEKCYQEIAKEREARQRLAEKRLIAYLMTNEEIEIITNEYIKGFNDLEKNLI